MGRKAAVLLLMGVLAACVTSRVTQVGNDTYRIELHRGLGFQTPHHVSDRAAKDADDYCDDNGRDAHIVSANDSELVFTCVARTTWEQEMDRAMKSLRGQNAHVAISLFGYPTQREILGDTVLEWVVDRYDSVALPTVHAFCTIQLATAPDGTIKNVHWNGNERGCATYIHAIKAP